MWAIVHPRGGVGFLHDHRQGHWAPHTVIAPGCAQPAAYCLLEFVGQTFALGPHAAAFGTFVGTLCDFTGERMAGVLAAGMPKAHDDAARETHAFHKALAQVRRPSLHDAPWERPWRSSLRSFPDGKDIRAPVVWPLFPRHLI